MISSPLLETKFHLPTPHGRLVPRARLSQQIGRATGATLTLVSAPAGFGKTTVMSELARRPDGAHVAWLSLDPADNDPVTFWTYVIEAVDRAAPGVGGAARSILAGAQGTVDAAVTTLLNGIAGVATDLVLVLDDFHVIESPAVHDRGPRRPQQYPHARGHPTPGRDVDIHPRGGRSVRCRRGGGCGCRRRRL